MKLKVVTGLVISLTMMSATYAATCPTISVSRSQDVVDPTFTSARVKDKKTSKSVVICRYEGKDDLGVSVGYRNGTPITTTGSGWTGDECTASGGDANTCAFQGKKK